jgi:uncharacterized protein YodC (DUF2158 family)
MDLRPGDVVMLKSGGHPMTVEEVKKETASCVWMGDQGALFRETLPFATLELVELDPEDDEEEDDEEEEEDDEETKVA